MRCSGDIIVGFAFSEEFLLVLDYRQKAAMNEQQLQVSQTPLQLHRPLPLLVVRSRPDRPSHILNYRSQTTPEYFHTQANFTKNFKFRDQASTLAYWWEAKGPLPDPCLGTFVHSLATQSVCRLDVSETRLARESAWRGERHRWTLRLGKWVLI